MPLGDYATAVAQEGRLDEAKRALELSHLIKPRNVSTWYQFALIAAASGESEEAVRWADQVLSFQPDPNSKDLWERAAAESVAQTPEEEKKTAQLLGDGDHVGLWNEMRAAMRAIKEGHGKSHSS
jgi:tetratricopeptide (TPR) repeat protein